MIWILGNWNHGYNSTCTTYGSIFAGEYNVFSYHGYDIIPQNDGGNPGKHPSEMIVYMNTAIFKGVNVIINIIMYVT